MECLQIFLQLIYIGTILSSKPENSIAMFKLNGKMFTLREGAEIAGRLRLNEIGARGQMSFKCEDLTLNKRFTNLNKEYDYSMDYEDFEAPQMDSEVYSEPIFDEPPVDEPPQSEMETLDSESVSTSYSNLD